MSNEEQVIAVMGSTGVGKSSFIQNSVPQDLHTQVQVGHGLQSKTSEVQPVCWVTEDGTSVKLVDTPGFDDSRAGLTDAEVLKMIATFLTNEYQGKKSRLTGLIYVHRISDTRVGKTSQRNLRMFQKLCGDESLKNVVIVTTMWDMVTPEDGLRREQELMSNNSPFKPLLDKEAIMRRHDRTPNSAADIVNYLLEKSPTTAQIVREIAEEGRALEYTTAGTELNREIRVEMEALKAEMHRMRTYFAEERQRMDQERQRELAEERQRMNQELQNKLTEERQRMDQERQEERQRMDRTMAKLLMELDELKRGITVNDPPPIYEPTNDFPAPETKCTKNCSKLLGVVKKHISTLAIDHSDIAGSVVSCTIDFADAVEKSVKGDLDQGAI
ncbi:P-loop containing nucleoside triphosphate hydrolase protein [Scleroderma citrinum]